MGGPRGGAGLSALRNTPGAGKVMARVLRLILRDYPVHCVAVIVAILVSTLAQVRGTLFLQTLIDDYILPMTKTASPDFAPLGQALIRLACIYVVGVLCAWAYNRIMVTVSQGTMHSHGEPSHPLL